MYNNNMHWYTKYDLIRIIIEHDDLEDLQKKLPMNEYFKLTTLPILYFTVV